MNNKFVYQGKNRCSQGRRCYVRAGRFDEKVIKLPIDRLSCYHKLSSVVFSASRESLKVHDEFDFIYTLPK